MTLPKIEEHMRKYAKRFRVKNQALQILDENIADIDENSQLILRASRKDVISQNFSKEAENKREGTSH